MTAYLTQVPQGKELRVKMKTRSPAACPPTLSTLALYILVTENSLATSQTWHVPLHRHVFAMSALWRDFPPCAVYPVTLYLAVDFSFQG